ILSTPWGRTGRSQPEWHLAHPFLAVDVTKPQADGPVDLYDLAVVAERAIGQPGAKGAGTVQRQGISLDGRVLLEMANPLIDPSRCAGIPQDGEFRRPQRLVLLGSQREAAGQRVPGLVDRLFAVEPKRHRPVFEPERRAWLRRRHLRRRGRLDLHQVV